MRWSGTPEYVVSNNSAQVSEIMLFFFQVFHNVCQRFYFFSELAVLPLNCLQFFFFLLSHISIVSSSFLLSFRGLRLMVYACSLASMNGVTSADVDGVVEVSPVDAVTWTVCSSCELCLSAGAFRVLPV